MSWKMKMRGASRPRQRWRRWLGELGIRLGPLLSSACLGCVSSGVWNVDNCADIPPGAIPEPHGVHVRRFQEVQAARAEADDFVIYKHEWYLGGNELGPYGQYHLDMITKRLPTVPFPVLIQVDANPQLNQYRRALIVGRLMEAGIHDAEQRVILGFPSAEGLYGEEAPPAFQGLLQGGSGDLTGAAFGRNLYPGYSTFRGGSLGLVTPRAVVAPGILP